MRVVLALASVLVLLSSGWSAAAGATMPLECVDKSKVLEILKSFKESNKITSYTCRDSTGHDWKVDRGHVSEVLRQSGLFSGFVMNRRLIAPGPSFLEAPAWSSLRANFSGSNTVPIWAGYQDIRELQEGGWYRVYLSWGWIGGPVNNISSGLAQLNPAALPDIALSEVNSWISTCIPDAAEAFSCTDLHVFFQAKLPMVVTDNVRVDLPPGPEGTPDPDAPPGGGTGGGSGSVPPAPNDEGTNCTILNIPCNFRILFIPNAERLKVMLSAANVSKILSLPIQVVETSRFSLCFQGPSPMNSDGTFGRNASFNFCNPEGMNDGSNQWIVIDWRLYMLPQPVKNAIAFILWLGLASWVLGYIGLPNPFARRAAPDTSTGNIPSQPSATGKSGYGGSK